ncbi:pyridoxal kinase [Aureimonas frigidaquae]|uniref:pyridoxal kinase n=1 Tax=Aureimonas frigidaquae TaxID=424757 RepID=A0A0P0Z3N7_9HYPH|nr:pyridoxal kinase [Aureimonas frigidaquae]BAT28648.1 pyridoxal kinase [Aureimonas frigidaquae]
MVTHVISIQSQVAYGHVGNSAAVFPMQAKGLEVAAVPTTLLSNHPHYDSFHGRVLDAELVEGLLVGLEERGVVAEANTILTGYLGSTQIGEVVARFLTRARAAHPHLRFVCDPVMGDDDLGMFVQPGLIDLFRDRLTPMADVITPNRYEVELLAGHECRTERELARAMAALHARGTRAVVVTGCALDDTPAGMVETILWQDGALHRTPVARLPIRPCGTGDLFTALMVARLSGGSNLREAVAGATQEIHGVLRRTEEAGAEEMRISGYPFEPVTPIGLTA